MLSAIEAAGLTLPGHYPKEWVVDCKSVGSGEKALIYLGRYLYRGVIREKDIIACKDGRVTFRYRNAKTAKMEHRTVSGAYFTMAGIAARAAQRFPVYPQLQFSAPVLGTSLRPGNISGSLSRKVRMTVRIWSG